MKPSRESRNRSTHMCSIDHQQWYKGAGTTMYPYGKTKMNLYPYLIPPINKVQFKWILDQSMCAKAKEFLLKTYEVCDLEVDKSFLTRKQTYLSILNIKSISSTLSYLPKKTQKYVHTDL